MSVWNLLASIIHFSSDGCYITGAFYNLLTDQSTYEKKKPGIRFSEKMVGTFWYVNNTKKDQQTACEFIGTIESDDVERMIKCDPAHAAKISGTVSCAALSSSPLTISQGKDTNLNR